MVRLPAGWRLHPLAGSGRWQAPLTRRIPVLRQELYAAQVRVPIGNVGIASTTVPASGDTSVMCGPQGAGEIWYPQTATFTSTSGAGDGSFATLYLGCVSPQTNVGGQVFAGGGSSTGLSIPQLVPGDHLIAVWAGAVPGDTVTLQVQGEMDALDA
jgi:hypothetical protein